VTPVAPVLPTVEVSTTATVVPAFSWTAAAKVSVTVAPDRAWTLRMRVVAGTWIDRVSPLLGYRCGPKMMLPDASAPVTIKESTLEGRGDENCSCAVEKVGVVAGVLLGVVAVASTEPWPEPHPALTKLKHNNEDKTLERDKGFSPFLPFASQSQAPAPSSLLRGAAPEHKTLCEFTSHHT
jgi:hypothetical protein